MFAIREYRPVLFSSIKKGDTFKVKCPYNKGEVPDLLVGEVVRAKKIRVGPFKGSKVRGVIVTWGVERGSFYDLTESIVWLKKESIQTNKEK